MRVDKYPWGRIHALSSRGFFSPQEVTWHPPSAPLLLLLMEQSRVASQKLAVRRLGGRVLKDYLFAVHLLLGHSVIYTRHTVPVPQTLYNATVPAEMYLNPALRL